MRASDLRHRVIQQSPELIDDLQGGQETESWTDIKTIFAKIEPQTGTEVLEHGKIAGQRRFLLTVRNRDINIDRSDRLLWGSRILQIETPVNPDAVMHWVTFDAFEQVN